MTNTASTNQKTTKSPEKQCQDLAFPNELDRMEYEPGAYLAEGAELLNHVACTLQGASLPSGSEAYQVSMSYPTSGGDGPVRTTKIPISGLALQLHPTVSLHELKATHYESEADQQQCRPEGTSHWHSRERAQGSSKDRQRGGHWAHPGLQMGCVLVPYHAPARRPPLDVRHGREATQSGRLRRR